ncbi:hypothetical protein [Paramicrobacterium fandaimingii]|uniref:hypothetical protein n=1 Tax=Paramicrobacterium fandaimingii TaxID=2708079 RepID=UPI0014201D9C|nr:hypothetical protein [Microbacterium fandaimingii]
MKLPRLEKIWTVAGVVCFLVGGVLLGIGRFGPGTMLMIACVVCLGSAMGAHRRRLKRIEKN